jgi:hypothetical protein
VAVVVVNLITRAEHPLLEHLHKSAENKSRDKDEHQASRDGKVVLLLSVAIFRVVAFLASDIWDFHDKSERDGTSDHATPRDEAELVEPDRLLLEKEAEEIEGTHDTNDATNHHNQSLNDDPAGRPPCGQGEV